MSKRPTRRRATRGAARTLAMGVAVAALVGMVSAGQGLATLAPPDERVLERQGRIKHQRAVGQADDKGRVTLPPELPEEPPKDPGPQLSDQQVAPGPVRTAPSDARGGPVAIAVVGALLLAVGAATTWRVRHRRPQPESTA